METKRTHAIRLRAQNSGIETVRLERRTFPLSKKGTCPRYKSTNDAWPPAATVLTEYRRLHHRPETRDAILATTMKVKCKLVLAKTM